MSELGAGTRGASLGFEAIRLASLKSNPSFFKKNKVLKVNPHNELLHSHVANPFGKRIKGIVKMYKKIAEKVAETADDMQFPLVISGDHSNAGGTIAGLKQAYPTKRIGVIWIDAHADLHSPFTSPSGNMHGMPLATAISEDNMECAINQPKGATIKSWNHLKGDQQRIRPSDIVFIALRDTESPEDHLIQKYGMKVIRTDEVIQSGVNATVNKSLEHLKACDLIYVSFDVDSMDTSVSVGTGTPVPGGLTVEQSKEILISLATNPKTCAMEFTEINPLLDKKGNVMAEVTFGLIEQVVRALDSK